jgi:hypothetical protein
MGVASPNEADLRRLAKVCGLSYLETEFIVEAFKPHQVEPAPGREAFEAMVHKVLSCEHPSFILDSLFYRRAWNSLVLGLLRREPAPPPRNVLATLFKSFSVTGSTEQHDALLWRWLEDFWLYTAHLCGTPPYRSLLHQLKTLPEFERCWRELGSLRRVEDGPLGVPYYYRHRRIGTYRIFTLRIVLPPVYYLKEYVPVDEAARRYVDWLRAQGPVRILADPHHHWSMDGDEPALQPSPYHAALYQAEQQLRAPLSASALQAVSAAVPPTSA